MIATAAFEAFSLSHAGAVAVMILLCIILLRIVKNAPNRNHKSLRYTLAVILLYTPLSGPVNALIRYSPDAWNKIYHTELPLFLCDLVSVLLGIALIKKSQRLAEVGYLWALTGTAQGLVTPVLSYDFPSLEYLFFFAQHGLAPVSAILLVWGFNLKPEIGVYKRVWLWTWGYLIVVMSFNFLLETNYSFLNGKPDVPTAYDYLGDYPYYLISLHAVAAIAFFLLLLPFKKKFRQS